MTFELCILIVGVIAFLMVVFDWPRVDGDV